MNINKRDALIAQAAESIKKLAACSSEEEVEKKENEEGKEESTEGKKDEEKDETEKVAFVASNEIEYELALMYGMDATYDPSLAKTASELLGVSDPVASARQYLMNAHLIIKEASQVAEEAEFQKAASIKVLVNHGIVSTEDAIKLANMDADAYLQAVGYGTDAE